MIKMDEVSYVSIRISFKKKSKPIYIPIEMNQKVKELKEKIYEEIKVKESNQILKFATKEQISTLKDEFSLESYGVKNKSVITLEKFFIENEDLINPDKQNIALIEELNAEKNINDDEEEKMDISRRIDFMNNIAKKLNSYQMRTIAEEKNDNIEEDDDNNLIKYQEEFANFAKFDEKVKNKEMIQMLEKYPDQLVKEIIEFQDTNGLTSLHFLIKMQNDFFISYLISRLKREVLKVEGENCPKPLIYCITNVYLYNITFCHIFFI